MRKCEECAHWTWLHIVGWCSKLGATRSGCAPCDWCQEFERKESEFMYAVRRLAIYPFPETMISEGEAKEIKVLIPAPTQVDRIWFSRASESLVIERVMIGNTELWSADACGVPIPCEFFTQERKGILPRIAMKDGSMYLFLRVRNPEPWPLMIQGVVYGTVLAESNSSKQE